MKALSYMVVIVITAVLTSVFQPLAHVPTLAQGGCQTFQETGKTACGKFLAYWQTRGGLAQQGFPISGEFTEVSDLNGKPYTVQYFERAVFELHPENQPPHDVLLSQLGTFQFKRKYPNGEPGSAPSSTPTNAPDPPQPPAIRGQTIEFKGRYDVPMRAYVTDVQETQSIPESPFHDGVTARGKFVVVFITITNIGSRSTDVRKYSFALRDSAGRVFDLADLAAKWAAEDHYKRSSYYKDIQAGLSEESVFVFDVAPDAANYYLVPGD